MGLVAIDHAVAAVSKGTIPNRCTEGRNHPPRPTE
jgi:hypothetical protein